MPENNYDNKGNEPSEPSSSHSSSRQEPPKEKTDDLYALAGYGNEIGRRPSSSHSGSYQQSHEEKIDDLYALAGYGNEISKPPSSSHSSSYQQPHEEKRHEGPSSRSSASYRNIREEKRHNTASSSDYRSRSSEQHQDDRQFILAQIDKIKRYYGPSEANKPFEEDVREVIICMNNLFSHTFSPQQLNGISIKQKLYLLANTALFFTQMANKKIPPQPVEFTESSWQNLIVFCLNIPREQKPNIIGVCNAVSKLAQLAKTGYFNKFGAIKLNNLTEVLTTVNRFNVNFIEVRTISNIIHDFGTLSQHKLLDKSAFGEEKTSILLTWLKSISTGKKEFTPQSLASLGWGIAKLTEHQCLHLSAAERITLSRHMLGLLAQMIRKIGETNPQHLANLGWAIAKLTEHHCLHLSAAETATLSRHMLGLLAKMISIRSEAKPQELASLGWAIAKLTEHQCLSLSAAERVTLSMLMLGLLAQMISISKRGETNPQHLANLSWAIAKLAEHHCLSLSDHNTQTLSKDMLSFLKQMVSKRDEAKPQELANLIWSLGKLANLGINLEIPASSLFTILCSLSEKMTLENTPASELESRLILMNMVFQGIYLLHQTDSLSNSEECDDATKQALAKLIENCINFFLQTKQTAHLSVNFQRATLNTCLVLAIMPQLPFSNKTTIENLIQLDLVGRGLSTDKLRLVLNALVKYNIRAYHPRLRESIDMALQNPEMMVLPDAVRNSFLTSDINPSEPFSPAPETPKLSDCPIDEPDFPMEIEMDMGNTLREDEEKDKISCESPDDVEIPSVGDARNRVAITERVETPASSPLRKRPRTATNTQTPSQNPRLSSSSQNHIPRAFPERFSKEQKIFEAIYCGDQNALSSLVNYHEIAPNPSNPYSHSSPQTSSENHSQKRKRAEAATEHTASSPIKRDNPNNQILKNFFRNISPEALKCLAQKDKADTLFETLLLSCSHRTVYELVKDELNFFYPLLTHMKWEPLKNLLNIMLHPIVLHRDSEALINLVDGLNSRILSLRGEGRQSIEPILQKQMELLNHSIEYHSERGNRHVLQRLQEKIASVENHSRSFASGPLSRQTTNASDQAVPGTAHSRRNTGLNSNSTFFRSPPSSAVSQGKAASDDDEIMFYSCPALASTTSSSSRPSGTT